MPVLLGVSFIVFMMMHLAPGDPAEAMLGPLRTEATLAKVRHELGLDQPLPVQYLTWLGRAVTGDLGSVDADGYVRISGRQKDIIIRGGHNIEPGIIENALLQSPWVAQAAAIGKPDAHAGELPIAYVELHPGAQVSAEELLRYAAERIPERPAVPKEITA